LPETTKTNKLSTAAKYGQYVPRENSETISSVDSDEIIETFFNIDYDNHEWYLQDEQAFVEQIILYKQTEQKRVFDAFREKQE
jgi:hypothetical protein